MAQATFIDVNGVIRLEGTLTGGTSVSESLDQIAAANATAADWDNAGFAITGVKDLAVSGLTGATQASRYVGATASGAPASGTFAVGDVVVARNGHIFVCTTAGTPGTWTDVGGAGNLVTSVFGRTGAVVATAGDYTGVAVGGTADALAALALTNAMVSASAAIATSKLADPTTGKVIGSSGGAAAAVYPPGYEFGYDQITSNVTVSSSTEATGTTVLSAAAHTFDGAPVIAEFYSCAVQPAGSDFVIINLFEGSTEIARLCDINQASVVGGSDANPAYGRYRFTPTAASHTYTVTAYRNSSNGTIYAGAGGTAVFPPAFLRFTKV